MRPYASEQEALKDVLRLSRGMTYKAALAEVPAGGGKSVIIGDPSKQKSDALLEAMGAAIDSLNGSYYSGQDMNIGIDDVTIMRRRTNYVFGHAGGKGDPAPATALGVYSGIKAAVALGLGRESLSGIRVAIQGLGSVGMELGKLLAKDGVQIVASDINAKNVARAKKSFGPKIVSPDRIAEQQVDVFSPNAIGGTINEESIQKLNATIVAGAANNQLETPENAIALRDRGVLYAPDYVINGGGLLHMECERQMSEGGENDDQSLLERKILSIGNTVAEIISRANREGRTTIDVADEMAERRLSQGQTSRQAIAIDR